MRIFVAPAAWHRLLGAVHLRFTVALVGARGSGKTSALRQLQRQLRGQAVRVVFVDATGAADLEHLVAAIEAELAGRPGALRQVGTDAASLAEALRGGPPGAASLRIVQRPPGPRGPSGRRRAR